MAVAFFFSSRRRHTRSLRDWSSDVCSSDLDDPFWIDVTVLRNYTVHTKNERLADYVPIRHSRRGRPLGARPQHRTARRGLRQCPALGGAPLRIAMPAAAAG